MGETIIPQKHGPDVGYRFGLQLSGLGSRDLALGCAKG